MDRTRRALLGALSVSALGGLAGCGLESAIRERADGGDGNGGGGPGGSRAVGTEVRRQYEGSDVSITLSEPRLRNYLFHTAYGALDADVPETDGYRYLTVALTIENTGSSPVDAPLPPVFVLEGAQYEEAYTQADDENRYDPANDIQPGVTQSGTVVYAIPDSEATGRFVLDLSTYEESITESWSVDLESVPDRDRTYSGLSTGETARFGTEDVGFDLTVEGYETSETVTYRDYEGEKTATAGEGRTYLELTVSAANVGADLVSVPHRSSFVLVAGDSQYEYADLGGEDRGFDGGELSTGVESSGRIVFEMDADADPDRVAVPLGSDVRGVWEL